MSRVLKLQTLLPETNPISFDAAALMSGISSICPIEPGEKAFEME